MTQYPDEDGMQIGELARKANVSVRTIRFYIAEGLLPAPQTRGRFTSYDEDALLRLQVIRYLKEAFLPLREIRDRLAGLTSREVRDLLSDLENLQASPQVPKSPAVDYIDQIKNYKVVPRHQVAEPDKAYSTPSPRIPAPQRMPPVRVPQAENWRHFRVGPGIIIQVSGKLDDTNEKRLEELLQIASRLFSSQGVSNV